MDRELKMEIKDEIKSWVSMILVAIVFALFINNFIIINAVVPTGSMKDTIMVGDRLIANRLSYTFSEPERGDIIVFPFPDNESVLYIKRIVGLPGETILIDEGNVYINGELLQEPYLASNDYVFHKEYVVPEGHYFMLGDNRASSADSRYWEDPYLEEKKILGKAIFRYFPRPKLLESTN
ncbi:MAG: signal peptidase I [Lachnospirales bacterium]